MPSYGVTTIANYGRSIMASADGVPRWKTGGVTIDWSTVTAVAADVTLADGRVVKAGQKYLRYGKVLTKITTGGKFGPYDADASDGREILARGNCFILNETVIMDQDLASDHKAVFDGGRVFEARVTDIVDVSTHQIANPSLADLNTAFPDVTWVRS